MKSVFIDSSVLFSAVNSPTGGSAKLFTLESFRLITSKLVLTEVERNVRKKLLDYHLERFFVLVEKLSIIDIPIESALIKKVERIIVQKDTVILAQAKQARIDFLVTLDRKHFFNDEVYVFIKPTKIITPKDLLKTA